MAQEFEILVLSEDVWFRRVVKPLQQLGHKVHFFFLNSEHLSSETLEAFETLLQKTKFHFCLIQSIYGLETHRDFGNRVDELLDQYGIPKVAWFLDGPRQTGSFSVQRRWLKGPYWKNILFLCVDRGHIEFFTSRGLPAGHLPIGIDPDIQKFVPTKDLIATLTGSLSFVGRPPFGLPTMGSGDESDLRKEFLSQFLRQFEQFASELPYAVPTEAVKASRLEDLLSAVFNNRSFNSKHYDETKTQLNETIEKTNPNLFEAWICFSGTLDYAYSYLQMVIHLRDLVDCGLRVYGGENWKNFIPDLSGSCRRLTQDELYTLFRSSKISFCFTKLGFRGAVHERPLLSLACGGFPITDLREELYEFFERDEIVAYRNLEECKELTRYYLRHESERERITLKGQKKVFSRHTFFHRMAILVALAEKQWNLDSTKIYPIHHDRTSLNLGAKSP